MKDASPLDEAEPAQLARAKQIVFGNSQALLGRLAVDGVHPTAQVDHPFDGAGTEVGKEVMARRGERRRSRALLQPPVLRSISYVGTRFQLVRLVDPLLQAAHV